MTPLLPPQHVVSKLGTRLIHRVLAPSAALFVSSTTASARVGGAEAHQPIFIVGPPRCGSTILYQAMTNYFDVLYVDNLAARWARALPVGISRSMRRFGRAPHNNFVADHGDTTSAGGWHAPSECGNLWYRWIPWDQHYVPRDEVSQAMIGELRSEFQVVQARWGAPLLIKNLHVGQRLAWVSQAFPEARFVCIHREPTEVVASILTARHRLGIPAHELWSTRPPVWEDLLALPEKSMVERQVERVTAEFEMSLSQLSEANVHHVRYEDFSPDLVESLGRSLDLALRAGGSLPTFGVSS